MTSDEQSLCLETIIATLRAMCKNRSAAMAFGDITVKIHWNEGRIKEFRFHEETIGRPPEPGKPANQKPQPPPTPRKS